MKVIKDFKLYLDHIDKLSKTLPKIKRADLENILKVQLTLLVSLKKSSELGKAKFDWDF
jgi:hypothetical protein